MPKQLYKSPRPVFYPWVGGCFIKNRQNCLTIRTRCRAFRYFPDPLGIVTAEVLDKLEFVCLFIFSSCTITEEQAHRRKLTHRAKHIS